jgi:tetratricopeptide (TPR) repeat protein
MMVVIVLCSYWTYERAKVWQGLLTIWMDAVQKSPHKARPHYNLGNVYTQKGQTEKAIAAYKRALAVNPNYANAHYNLGI